MDEVRCEIRRSGAAVHVTLAGRLDRAAHPELRRALRRAFEKVTRGRVVVDLAGVESIGSECLEVLLVGYTRALRSGHGYEVTGAHGAVRQALAVTGLCERDLVTDDELEALLRVPSAAQDNAA